MKNLPDNELFEQMGSRLRHYQEVPDEKVWENIAAATKTPSKNSGMAAIEYTALAISIVSILFLIMPAIHGVENNPSADPRQAQENYSKSNRNSNLDELASKSPVVSKSESESKKASTSTSASIMQTTQRYSQESVTPRGKIYKNETEWLVDSKITNSDQENLLNPKNPSVTDKEYSFALPALADAAIDSTQKASAMTKDSLAKSNKEEIITPAKKKKHDFNFYIALSPLLNYRQITPLQNDGVVVTRVGSESVLSGQRFGLALETGFQAQLNAAFEVYAGLSYYQQNQTLTYRYATETGNPIDNLENPLAFGVRVSEQKKEVNYQMNNIGLQCGLLYQLRGGPLTQKVGVGLWYQHGLGKKSDGETYSNSESSYLAYQILYRNEYAFSNQLKIYLQPNFTYSIYSAEVLSEPFKVTPYSVGLSLGVIYKINGN